MLINFQEMPPDGDRWESFTRDLLVELGFVIETPPDRGPDGGKDMLAVEQMRGIVNSRPFRWLVSCKHFAHSGRAVSETDEPNILERVASFRADGFLGVYSTVVASGLNTRLAQLRREGRIGDYQIFDAALLESIMLRIGFSLLTLRYFPESHKEIRPLHPIFDGYEPLECPVCEKDILVDLFNDEKDAVYAEVVRYHDGAEAEILDIYWACKGECDEVMQDRMRTTYGEHSGWTGIRDLIIPSEFLRFVMATINQLTSGAYRYNKDALEKTKRFILALGQKTMREPTEREVERARRLNSLSAR